MLITIHQVEHMPWLGLLHKIDQANLFVLADNFQFKKNYFENRNKIRTKTDWQWLTVPVEHDNHKPINEVRIIYTSNWQRKYLETLKYHYNKTPYFNNYYPEIENIIMEKSGQNIYISNLNEVLLLKFLSWFNIITTIIKSSTLDVQHLNAGSSTLLEICQKIKATEYLSGISGKKYLDINLFQQNNINVKFHEFVHPIYKQQYEPFIPGMSAIDYLFNKGNILPWKK